jgi:hypothetical protein
LRGGWRPLSLRTPLLWWEGTKSPLIPLYERGTIMVGLKLRDKQRMRLGSRVGKDNYEGGGGSGRGGSDNCCLFIVVLTHHSNPAVPCRYIPDTLVP